MIPRYIPTAFAAVITSW